MTGETQAREIGRPDNKRGIGARLSKLVFGGNRPPSAYGYNAQELDSAARERMFVEARTEKERQARDKLVEALNNIDLDFGKSFTGTFRPKGPYVKFPAAERVIWTTFTDVVFDKHRGLLEVEGQKHSTQTSGKERMRSWIDRQKHESYTFGVELGEDGTVTDVRLPRGYAYQAIQERWPGREDLARMESTQEDFRAAAYEGATDYVRSFSVFMAGEADQVTVAYSDGHPPIAPPVVPHTYADEWGMYGGTQYWV